MNKDDFFKKIFMFVRKIDFFFKCHKKVHVCFAYYNENSSIPFLLTTGNKMADVAVHVCVTPFLATSMLRTGGFLM